MQSEAIQNLSRFLQTRLPWIYILANWLYKQLNKREERRFSKPSVSIPQIYSSGYSVSEFLREKKIKDIDIYVKFKDLRWAKQVLWDLSLQTDIDIHGCISNFWFPVIFPKQNFTNLMIFKPGEVSNTNSLVLFLSPNKRKTNIIQSSGGNIVDLRHVIADLWQFGLIIKNLKKLRNMYPYLPIILRTGSSFPKKREDYSEYEKYIVDNHMDHYNTTIWPDLQKPNAKIPRVFEQFDYSVDDLIDMLNPSRSLITNGIAKLHNYSSKYVNIVDNHRVTVNHNPHAAHTIHMHGGCVLYGVGCPDDKTIPSILQSLLNTISDNNYNCENYGNFAFGRDKYVVNTAMQTDYRPGDILYLEINGIHRDMAGNMPDGVFCFDWSGFFERPHDYGEVFFDKGHLNENGQRVVAEKLFEYLQSYDLFKDFMSTSPRQVAETLLSQDQYSELEEYKQQLLQENRIGAIVMNCNPFTLGHRYLIEYASSKVDKLFIFVVEEDKSVFPFDERIELVRQGTADLYNVKVLPSGKFIISALTFDDYFGKDKKQEDVSIDPSMDVELFAKHIAPTLGIRVRFAGEEPLDNLTRQYNNTMQRILPRYDIVFEVIPRKEQNSEVISASRVRRLLETHDYDAIAKLVPKTTLSYLVNKFGDGEGVYSTM